MTHNIWKDLLSLHGYIAAETCDLTEKEETLQADACKTQNQNGHC